MNKKYIMQIFCAAFLVVIGGFVSKKANGQTATFLYTGGSQTWAVPAGVTSVTVDAQGATGGNSFDVSTSATNRGGNGGRVQATLAVVPGQVLTINVGGAGISGPSGGSGGYNGGGQGTSGLGYNPGCGFGCWTYYGGGGGGGTDISNVGTKLIAAGGGGGAATDAFYGTDQDRGGDGGGLTGENGVAYAGSGEGDGGSSVAGGAGGSLGGYGTAFSGTLGSGGSGHPTAPGGGGGGGYYGGGGSVWGGAGGGSSYTDATLATSVTHTRGYNSGGDGSVVITYIPGTSVPTLSQWGLTIFSLLMLTFGLVFMYKKQNAMVPAGAGAMTENTNNSAFDRNLYAKVLGGVLTLAVLGLAVARMVYGSVSLTDTIGTLVSALVVAYMVQLAMLMKKK